MLKLGLTWARAVCMRPSKSGHRGTWGDHSFPSIPPPSHEAGRLPFWKTQRENSLKAGRDLGW